MRRAGKVELEKGSPGRRGDAEEKVGIRPGEHVAHYVPERSWLMVFFRHHPSGGEYIRMLKFVTVRTSVRPYYVRPPSDGALRNVSET